MTDRIRQTVPFKVDSMASKALAETVLGQPYEEAWTSAAWRLLDDNGWIEVGRLAHDLSHPYRDRFIPVHGTGLCDGAIYVDNGDGKVSKGDLVSLVVAPAVITDEEFKPQVRLVARIWESSNPRDPRVMIPEQWSYERSRIKMPERLDKFLDFIKGQEGVAIGVITSMGEYTHADPDPPEHLQWTDGPLMGAGFCSRVILSIAPTGPK